MAEAALQETSPEGDEVTEILAGNVEPEGDEEEIEEGKETDESTEEPAVEGAEEGPGETEKEASTEEGESKEDEEAKVEAGVEIKAEEKLNAEVDSLQEENAKLRSYMRGMKQDLAVLKARGARDDKTIQDELEEGEEGVKPTRIEELASAVKNTLDVNRRLYTIQADQMRGSKDFGDIDAVCTEKHWDEIVDAAAEGIASQKGIDTVEARLEVEHFVWNQDNPYQYMYDTIKEYHPDYKEGKTESGGDEDVVKETKGKKSGKDKEAPGSVAAINSSSTGKSGWTSEKIDKLPEADLHKVPKDVYDKYMKDELD